ncbi:hypothetical protein KUTeg_016931 [Tegillarca granosa]|uniref:Uncharacterized protein n=1 Tax=Tegillarca granosa TaxID=220873 RepID=A0ABQ9ER63_TEGGR|nr:hypothetical protein KUTeg_016931 [Tegillarca granosa]
MSTVSGDEENEERKIGGIGLDELHESFALPNSGKSNQKMSSASNRSLMAYFAKLGHSMNPDEMLELDFVDSLLRNGASINTTDRHGQTLLHEVEYWQYDPVLLFYINQLAKSVLIVARTWHTDVAKFLLEHGADVNQTDNYGRSPLHVAAAVDYPEMVVLLIENGANKEARTKGEEQTPVHYAAKNDACISLRTLIKLECDYKTVRDYKGRTPLHLAAELGKLKYCTNLLEKKRRESLYCFKQPQMQVIN